jgi:hypothetical protein
MRPKKTPRKAATKVDEHDFAQLDAWARSLAFEDGRPLSAPEKKAHDRAKYLRRGRPPKAPSDKAGRYLVSLDPELHDAAVKFSRVAKMSLSGLIADALVARMTSAKSTKVPRSLKQTG